MRASFLRRLVPVRITVNFWRQHFQVKNTRLKR